MPGRVLVVDDIQPNLTLLEAKLSSEYYEVLTADNGEKALEMARTQSPDIILLDVMMPGLDGFTVCERLKADTETTHIPVVMVTALSDASDRVRGLRAGADDFLTKPVRDVPLFARVRSLIRLKQMMDVWRVREQTSSRLGLVPAASVMAANDISPGRILILEDSPIDAMSLSRTLELDQHEAVRVLTCEEAIQSLTQEPWDLVIAALHIAGSDVLRFCSQVRSHIDEGIRSIPVLLLADDDSDSDKLAKALDIGVNDFVTRPVDREELRARVRIQLRRRRYQNGLRSNYERSIELASIDPLTGVYNRRYLESHLEHLLADAMARHKPLSIAYCDIDHFKRLNDNYGHDCGDMVLKEFTRRLVRNLRSLDLVARIGGEEFVVVMPDTPPERAARIGERLRQKVETEPFPITQGRTVDCTVSLGLVTTDSDKPRTSAELLKLADHAMLAAKQGGRNQVRVASLDD